MRNTEFPDDDHSESQSSLDPLLAARKRSRHAGPVMAILGLAAFGLFSPYGLILSAEKMWEPGRSRCNRVLDIIGFVLSWIGNIPLPFVLYSVWKKPGPEFPRESVVVYLAVFADWMAHRLLVVWRSGVTGPWAIDPDRERGED